MNKLHFPLAISGVLITTLALTGCATGISMEGMNDGSMSSETPSSSNTEADFNNADVSFAAGMVVHHEQAIEMSDIVLAKVGVDERVTALAERIKASQGPEIDTMNGWLESWGESTGMSGSHGMDGEHGSTMGEEDMQALGAANGPDASALFLTQMIEHHTGAIMMAEREVTSGSNSEAVALAKKIVDDQTAEIAEMKELVTML